MMLRRSRTKPRFSAVAAPTHISGIRTTRAKHDKKENSSTLVVRVRKTDLSVVFPRRISMATSSHAAVASALFLLCSISLLVFVLPNIYSNKSPVRSRAIRRREATAEASIGKGGVKRRVQFLTEVYSAVVADFTDMQTMSWNVRNLELELESLNRTAAVHHDEGNAEEAGLSPSLRCLRERYLKKTQLWESASQSSAVDSGNKAAPITAEKEGDIIWDDEEDIPRYFDKLLAHCSPPRPDELISTSNSISDIDACWGLLNGLVREPRCTVRFDSRVECRRKCNSTKESGRENTEHVSTKLGNERWRMDASASLLRSHLGGDDAVNVIILGAGPAGLQLANTLSSPRLPSIVTNSNTTMNKRGHRHHVPFEVHIMVFENRLHSPGQKRPYSRDWLTSIELNAFDPEINDPRLVSILRAVHDPGENVALPINAIETLLLLSNRDRGVKFLYENYEDHEDIIVDLPNLVVFDATGHRIDELDRGGKRAHAGDEALLKTDVQIRRWRPRNDGNGEEWYGSDWFDADAYNDLVRTGSVVQIAERQTGTGTVLYLVLPDGFPFTAHFIKVNDLRMSSSVFLRLKDSMYAMVESTKHTHVWCREQCNADDAKSDFKYCFQWCSRAFAWDSGKQYRYGIYKRLKSKYPGFATKVAFLSLSSRQAHAFSYLLSGSSAMRRGVVGRHLLRDLPIVEMIQEREFRKGGLAQRLEWFRHLVPANATISDTEEGTTVNVFTFAPYMYKSPVVPGGIFGDRAPLLRIGDSLLNGDPNLGNGLCSHMTIINRLVRGWLQII